MLKLQEIKAENSQIISISDMKPLQVGKVVDRGSSANGHFILRTASSSKFEVIDLSKPGVNSCWTSKESNIKVRLLSNEETLTLELFNEE